MRCEQGRFETETNAGKPGTKARFVIDEATGAIVSKATSRTGDRIALLHERVARSDSHRPTTLQWMLAFERAILRHAHCTHQHALQLPGSGFALTSKERYPLCLLRS
jgi:hypothetical protein